MKIRQGQLAMASRLIVVLGLVTASTVLAAPNSAQDVYREIMTVRADLAEVESSLRSVDVRIETEADHLRKIWVMMNQPRPDRELIARMFFECQKGIDWIDDQTEEADARLMILLDKIDEIRDATVRLETLWLLTEADRLSARWNQVCEHNDLCCGKCVALQSRYDWLWRQFQPTTSPR